MLRTYIGSCDCLRSSFITALMSFPSGITSIVYVEKRGGVDGETMVESG